MPDDFDPYREALVIENVTVWPDDFEDLEKEQRDQIAAALHADAGNASHLEYIRVHTGFCRQITATAADVERLLGS